MTAMPNTFNLRVRLQTLQREARLEQLHYQLDALDTLFGKVDKLLADIEASLAAARHEPSTDIPEAP